MRVGIITFHFAWNYGAVLQCLALSETLKEMGHEICVINYRPRYHVNQYSVLRNPIYYGRRVASKCEKNCIAKYLFAYLKGFIGAIYSWRNYPLYKKINEKFNQFTRTWLCETLLYRNIADLKKHPPDCDIYISGSDQIWNTTFTNGKLDPAYLLGFGSEQIIRISYAVSVNSLKNYDFTQAEQELLRKFRSISLREEEYYPLLRKLLDANTEIHIDVDPTLLLDENMYEKYMAQNISQKEPFLLVYTMNNEMRARVYQAAHLLSKQTGLMIIDISNSADFVCNEKYSNRVCSPAEFLWYVKHSEFLLTNSFHGTVFSIIFEKNFVTMPNLDTGNRITEFLSKLNLSSHCAADTETALLCFTEKINYSTTKMLISDLRKKSIEYLKKNTLLQIEV